MTGPRRERDRINTIMALLLPSLNGSKPRYTVLERETGRSTSHIAYSRWDAFPGAWLSHDGFFALERVERLKQRHKVVNSSVCHNDVVRET
jgi:hypothetical protein